MKLINFISPGKLKLFLAECKKIFAPISHIHKTSDIENLDENLNNKYDKTAVQTQGTVLAAPSYKDGIADFRKLTKEDIGLGDVAQIVHLTKAEYKELEKKGQLNPDIDYATTDESDNITDSSVQLWNTSSSLAQQGKYLSYSDQNGGKYLSLMNSSDNTAVAHAKLMDGESGEGMDVDADKVKTVDSKGILVEALGETTAQALIDEVAKRVIDLTGRMSTTENGLQSANDAITSLNSDLPGRAKIANISSLASIGDIFKTYSKNGSIPVIGIINWDTTLAPDRNVTIAFIWNYLIVAISSSGCIYTASPNAATWQKRN
ncbi:hypothetical protein DW085_01650 [Clostridium sp. AF50-3]|uniref:hypothetical protein n=1 Tax=Clostridium sp. AF50-3 TaxID=2293021 RepID=UPI000E4F5ACD|nr:hypothetical protein [Clostridium sp. AF50-3]RHO69717.1 hypothetical protein DW085_01650 [Clostridium sp. AF50-3]